jgi:hypothetical protein
MPNQLAVDVEILFENTLLGFDAACVLSKEVDVFYPDQADMQRANGVIFRPQDYQINLVTGIDLSAVAKADVIQRNIPAVYKPLLNSYYEINAFELRDQLTSNRAAEAAGMRLAAQIDSDMYREIATQASIVVKKVGAFSWDDAATAEEYLISRGAPAGVQRKLFTNATDYKAVVKDFGGRQFVGDFSKDAITRSKVPDLSMFSTFRTDNFINLPGIGVVTGTTVLATTTSVVSAMTANLPTDNRRSVLTIAGANIANIKNGDCFAINNVNAVHNITKDDTGIPMTFRVISGGGTASLTVSPGIFASGPYQNVTAPAIAAAAITFLNTATRPVNPFFVQGAVELMAGRLEVPKDQGVKIMEAKTANGMTMVMMKYFNGDKLSSTLRTHVLYGCNVLLPELCGIIIANQT